MSGRPDTPAIRPEVERLLVLAVFAWAALVLVLSWRGLGFFGADWTFLLDRRGSFDTAIANPHNEHIVVGLAAMYRLMTAVFGLNPAAFHVLLTVLFFAATLVVFVYLRRRVGGYLALLGTATLLLIGAAYQDLLWPIQMGYFAAFACGLGALMLLERDDARGDVGAAALLSVSILTFTVGLAFIAGAAVSIALRARRWQRAYVVAVPAALFCIWWIAWGSSSDSAIDIGNVLSAPAYVFDGFATGFAALLGLDNSQSLPLVAGIEWGRPIAAVAGVAAVMHIIRLGKRTPRTFWVIFATAVAFWFILGCFETAARQPVASRFQHAAAVFVVLIGAELIATIRVRRATLVVITLVALAAIASNVNHLGHASERFGRITARERGGLTALELTRDSVAPEFTLGRSMIGTGLAPVPAGAYLDALDDYGHSPAFTEAELTGAPAKARIAADRTLAAALGVTLERRDEPAPPGDCTLIGGSARPTVLPVGSGLWIDVKSGKNLRVRIARYGKEYSFIVGRLRPPDRAILEIPPDLSAQPWRAEFAGDVDARVCAA